MSHRRHTTRALAALSAAVVALVASGCGSSGGGGGLDSSLKYYSTGTQVLVVVSTDLQSTQFKNLDTIVEARAHKSLEELLQNAASDAGLSWQNDVKPLLGHELMAGASVNVLSFAGAEENAIATFRATDGGKLKKVLGKLHSLRKGDKVDGAQTYRLAEAGGPSFAVDGDVLVAALSSSVLRAALDRAHGGDHLSGDKLDRATTGLPTDALARGYVDVSSATALPEVSRLRGIPWFDALRTMGLAVSFPRAHAEIDANLNTDPSSLKDGDLPFVTGDDPPEVLTRPNGFDAGNRNQSATTVFVYHVAEAAFPGSRFVKEVHALQRQLHIDFVDEVLRQFDRPSASFVSLDGKTFAARSDVSDPARLARVLPRLGPHLPAIVRALQGLQSQGEALLFLFAPDIVFGKGKGVQVVSPASPGGLWHVTGLTGQGPRELWFGLIGKRFVVASSEALAHQIANAPTRKVSGAHGAADARIDLSTVARDQLERSSANLESLMPLGDFVTWSRASRARLRVHASLELP